MIRSLLSLLAVNNKIGVFNILRRSIVKLSPSSPGIITSRTIISNSRLDNKLLACAASRATDTKKPLRNKNFCKRFRILSSSSTINMCA